MICEHQHCHDRKFIRLKGYDYRSPGAYFVTLVSWQRECLFGEVSEGRMRLNCIGNIIDSEWRKLTDHFPNIRADAFVIIPNHGHGIIGIEDISTVRATRPTNNEIMDSDIRWVNQTEVYRDGSPLQDINRPNGPLHGSLGAFIGQFKSRATKRIWALPGMDRHPIWQRNYYEHIIRDEQEHQQIFQYIETNPFQWEEDEYHSLTPGKI